MTNDPVLIEQARNRKALDAMLARHGWRLGAVKPRAHGTVLGYELIRTSDDLTIEHSVLLSDILLWNATAPMSDDLAPLFMLGLQLVMRVKQHNAAMSAACSGPNNAYPVDTHTHYR
jgi:hypothetical protein